MDHDHTDQSSSNKSKQEESRRDLKVEHGENSDSITLKNVSGMGTRPPSSDDIVIERGLGHLDLHVYKRRWLILIMYSLSTSFQAAIWNQWGPIAAVSERVYGWTDGVIAMFANWGPIMFISTSLVWSWLVDSKGLRLTCVSAAGLIAVGSGLRCLVRSPPTFTWLVHICHILNGLSGPMAMGAVPRISAVWFPPQERATATAISYAMAVMGFSLTFLIADVLAIQQDRIMYYMYGTFAVCAALFLAMLAYFPNGPPKPPSPSASTPRLDYVSGLKQLLKKWRFWQIGLAYGVSTGVRDSWSSMLDVNLKSHGISQSEAGWLGFYGTMAGAVAGIIAGRFADRFQTRLRLFLLLLNVLTIAAYLWLVLQIMDYIPESKVSQYVAIISAAVTGFVVSPLFYELVCETAYPVSEGISNICLTTMNNMAILVFLGILSIPNTGTEWMNWLLVSSFALAIILLIFLPDGHNRLDIDKKGENALKDVNEDTKCKEKRQNFSKPDKMETKHCEMAQSSLASNERSGDKSRM